MTPALEASGITVRYGGVVAVDDISIIVSAGELVGLIGANGAGKTTFVDAVSGFAPHSGHVVVAGHDVTNLAPHRRASSGIGRTFQAGELFGDLTVLDNLEVATRQLQPRDLVYDLMGRREDSRRTRAIEALAAVGLEDRADASPSELSLGQVKLVGVARALAMGPHVLLLDEPAAGLGRDEGAVFATTLRSLVTGNLGALMIDHDADMMFGICDRIVAIDFGRVIASGTPAEVRANPAVERAYLGTSS